MKKRTGIGLSLTSLAPLNSIRRVHVAYWNRGWAHAKKEEYGAAIKDMQKASQLQAERARLPAGFGKDQSAADYQTRAEVIMQKEQLITGAPLS